MGDTSIDLLPLLGQVIDAPTTIDLLKKVDPTTQVKLDKLAREVRWISKPAGVVIYSQKKTNRITTIFLYSEGEEGFHQFQGPLPNSLSFSMTQPQVQGCFPTPPKFTNAERDAWDALDRRTMVYYRATGTISQICLTNDF